MTVKQAALCRLDGLQNLRAAGRVQWFDVLCRRIVGRRYFKKLPDHWENARGPRLLVNLKSCRITGKTRRINCVGSLPISGQMSANHCSKNDFHAPRGGRLLS